MNLAGYEISDRIALPEKHDYGIGIIGCGGIVNYGHLPAYRTHGLHVVACYDKNRDTAEKTAAEFGILAVPESVDELIQAIG